MISPRRWQALPAAVLLAGAVCVGVLAAVLAGERTHAQVSTFTVNTTADEQDVYPGDGLCETTQGNGVCSLRAAVQESNVHNGADVIVLPSGVYTLTLAGILEDEARYGDLDILDDLTVQGAGAAITMIDGNQLDRVIDLLWMPSELEITGVTIRNGSTDFPAGIRDDLPWLVENGGCIRNLRGALTLRASAVTGCRAGRAGGGIYSERELVLDRTVLRENQAGEVGGGVFVGAIAFPTPTPYPYPTSPLPTPTSTATPFLFETPTPTVTPSPLAELAKQAVDEVEGVESTATVTPVPVTATPAPPPTDPPPNGSAVAIIGDSVIEDNIAAYGGGVYNNGQIDFHKVILRGNHAGATVEATCCADGGGPQHHGGAIYSEGRLTLSNSLVISNTASASGGGLVNRAVAELYRSDFVGNRAGADGGGMLTSYWLKLSETTVRDNEAGEFGGGIAANDPGGYYPGTLVLEGSTVSNNASHGRGGGIANGTQEVGYEYRQVQLWLANSTISGNVADGHGGGLYTGVGELDRVFLDNVTIAANVADADGDDRGDGGGLFNRLGEVRLRNSILAANEDHSPGTQRPDCWTPRRLDSGGYNLIGVAATCPLDGIVLGNLWGIDPRLGPLQDNGGRTETHALLADSPAIDAGNPSGCLSTISRYLIVDQRTAMRTVDGNGDGQAVCDMGAYEFASVQPIHRYLPLLSAR